jgi:hypothetical protein
MISAYRRCPGGAGRRLAGAHNCLLRLQTERVEKTPRSLVLLLYKILQHPERVSAALRPAAPDHA